MTATQQTKAEIKARAMAERLDSTGNFNVEVVVEPHDAEYYSDGGVMFPARVTVHVHAHGKRLFDDSYGFSFTSFLPAEGHRASTKFLGGTRIRTLASSRRDRCKKLSLRGMWFALSSEVDNARYAAQRAAQEA